MIKTYRLANRNEALLTFFLGKTKVLVDFKGGSIQKKRGGGRVLTKSGITQIAIENSEAFKSGQITLVKAIEEPKDAKKKAYAEKALIDKAARGKETVSEEVVKAETEEVADLTKEDVVAEEVVKAETEESEVKIIEEVTTIAEAVEYLNTNFNVIKSHIKTKDTIKVKAEENGVSFPNFK